MILKKHKDDFFRCLLFLLTLVVGCTCVKKKLGMSFGSVKDELDGMFRSLPKPNLMSNEEFNEILYTSENDAEGNRIKHTICSA